MKKSLLIAGVLGMFAVSSCTKDYTCECTETGSTTKDTYTFQDVKKKDAQEACDVWSTLYSLGGGSCELK